MDIFLTFCEIILYEIWWYGFLWIGFVAVAFLAARYLGCLGMAIGVFLIAVALLALDFNWAFDEMRDHPENGRDVDGPFFIGVVMRAVVFNVLLLPISFYGLKKFRRVEPREPSTVESD